jgi:hypothetical protein
MTVTDVPKTETGVLTTGRPLHLPGGPHATNPPEERIAGAVAGTSPPEGKRAPGAAAETSPAERTPVATSLAERTSAATSPAERTSAATSLAERTLVVMSLAERTLVVTNDLLGGSAKKARKAKARGENQNQKGENRKDANPNEELILGMLRNERHPERKPDPLRRRRNPKTTTTRKRRKPHRPTMDGVWSPANDDQQLEAQDQDQELLQAANERFIHPFSLLSPHHALFLSAQQVTLCWHRRRRLIPFTYNNLSIFPYHHHHPPHRF